MNRLRFLVIAGIIACGQHESPAPPVIRSSASPAITDTEQPWRVNGDDVIAPVAIKRVDIDFKPCLERKIDLGFPIIEAVIDKNGVPQNVRLLKPLHPCVEKQVLTAVRQWRFRPGTHRGQPVAVIYNMTVHIDYR